MTRRSAVVFVLLVIVLGVSVPLSPNGYAPNDNRQAARSATSVPLSIGGQQLHVGMSREEALQKLAACCTTFGGDDDLFIAPKATPRSYIGAIFFRDGRVSALRRYEHRSHDEATALFVLKMIRMVDDMAKLTDGQSTITTNIVEDQNFSGREILLRFSNGRIVRISHSLSLDIGKAVNLYEER